MNFNTTLKMGDISTMRLYGGVIAIVSGIYSLLSAIIGMMANSSMDMGMTNGLEVSMWAMILLGLIVLVHGVILLTPFVSVISSLSGPLMIFYSVLMLSNQAFLGITSNLQRISIGMSSPNMEMTLDIGMVAIALLMFISGLIMITHKEDNTYM